MEKIPAIDNKKASIINTKIMLANLCKGDKTPLGVVTVFFFLTVGVSTILAVTLGQHAAYLWLSFVLIGILFLTTFTRSNPAAPSSDSGDISNRRTSDHLRACERTSEPGPAPPYYVRIDPPPSYNAVITISPDNCDPPPYINVVIQPPNAPPPPATPPINYETLPKAGKPNSSSIPSYIPIILPPITEQLPILQQLATHSSSSGVTTRCLETTGNSSNRNVSQSNNVYNIALNDTNEMIPPPVYAPQPNSIILEKNPPKENNESTATT